MTRVVPAAGDRRMGFQARPENDGRARKPTLRILLVVFLLVLIRPITASAQTEADNTFGDDAQVSRDIQEILAGPDFRRLRVEAPAPREKAETKTPEWLEKFFRWLGELFSRAGGAFSALGALLQGLAYGV